jgi:hypothetical protein
MSLETLKGFFEIGGVALLALTFAFGAGALIVNYRLNAIQGVKLRNFDKDLTAAKLALGKQEVLTADATSRVAGLETDVADAKTEMAKQQTRAATAERRLLELQERIKPRRLTDKESKDFVTILSKLSDTTLKLGYTAGGGDEGFNLLKQLMPLFKQAHWNTPDQTTAVANHLEIQVIGIGLLIPGAPGTDPRKKEPTRLIRVNPVEAALQAAFKAVGMDLQFINWFPSTDGTPELVVGSKPEP